MEANTKTVAIKSPTNVKGGGGVAVRLLAEALDDDPESWVPTLTVALTKFGPQPILIVWAAGIYVCTRGFPLTTAESLNTAIVACVH